MPFSIWKHETVFLFNLAALSRNGATGSLVATRLGALHHQTRMCHSAITHKHTHWIKKSIL